MGNLLTILPLAVVMSAGPQIVSATLLATSENPRKNSTAFLLGVTVATAVGVTIAYVVTGLLSDSGDDSGDGSESNTVDYVIIALLLFLVVRVFWRRKQTEPPKWMGKLQTATPKFSFRLGLLLYLAMPTDVVTMITVGSWLSARDASLLEGLPFLFLTVLLAGVPLIMLLLLGARGEALLPRIRDWMNANSWIISEAVIAFFLVMTINGLD